MGVEFNCPKCQRVLDSDDRAEPDRIVCGGCGARIKVKASPPPAARPQIARRYVPPVAAPAEPDDGGFEVVGDAADDSSHGFEVIDDPGPPRADDTPRPRNRKSEVPSKREPIASPRPSRKLLFAVGGGGLLAVVLVGGLLALIFGGGGSSDGGGRVKAVAKARPATPKAAAVADGLESPTINAASWKVTADPVPVATGLKSAVGVIGTLAGGTVADRPLNAYADPAAGCLAAGSWQSGGVEFLNLREADARIVMVSKENRRVLALALSPSGDRAAVLVRDELLVRGKPGQFLVLLDTADGRWLWHVPVPVPEAKSHWVGFAGADRLMTFAEGTLQAYDAKTGQASGAPAAMPFVESPKLSPGRRWLYGRTAGGYEWYDAASLARAGTLTLPAEWVTAAEKEQAPSVALTTDLDGTRAVLASSRGKKGTMRVALLDLGAGTVTGCKSCRGLNSLGYTSTFQPEGTWCEGDDKLIHFPTGDVLQWDAGRLGMNYSTDRRTPLAHTGYAPDRRFWSHMTQAKEEFVDKTGSQLDHPTPSFLVAVTLLPPADFKLRGGKPNGSPWPPGTPLRIESNGDGDAAHHEEVVEIVASAYAEQGHPIDPKAKAGIRVTTGLLAEGKVRAIGESGQPGKEMATLKGGSKGDDRDVVLRTFRSDLHRFASPTAFQQEEPDDTINKRTQLPLGVDGLVEPELRAP